MPITAAAFGTAAVPAAATVSAPAPAGVALGDLLLIWVNDVTSTVTFTLAGSTGWTTVGPASGQNCVATLFYKNADATDVSLSGSAGSYTLTPSAAHSTEGVIIRAPGYSFDAGAGAPPTAGAFVGSTVTSFPATGVTTTSNGDTLLLLVSGRIASGAPNPITLAAGFTTLLALTSSSAAAAANVGVTVGTQTQTSAGATGTQTSTASGVQDGGALLIALTPPPVVAATVPAQAAPRRVPWWPRRRHAQQYVPAPVAQLALRSAQAVTTGGGAATLNFPAQACAIGDLIFIWASTGFASLTFSANPADNLVAATANTPASPAASTQYFSKIADATDVARAAVSGSYTITVSTSHTWSGVIGVVPVTDTVHPLDPADDPGSGQTSVASTNAAAASITTTGGPRLLVWLGSDRIAAGGVPPAMTPPAGYTIPAGLAQANSSGSGTINTGVLAAYATQAAAGATGVVSGTFTGAQISSGLLLAVKASGITPLPGTVGQVVAGAPTSSTVSVVAKTTGATSVRLAYSTHSDMSSPSFVAAQAPDGLGYVRYTPAGLAARTRYYVQLMDTPAGGMETPIGPVGACKTLPAAGTPASFTVALVSCIAEQDTTTPPALDVAMADWVGYDADLNIFTGDLDYSGTTSTSLATQTGIFETQVARYAQLAAMVSTRWGYYCRSDHEAGPDNGDSNNGYTAANIAAAQQVFPFGTLGDTVNTPVHGLYQAWVVGRVRFIMIDVRNIDRSPGANTDNGSKTMLGAAQLAWLESQLVQPEPLKVIISDVAWMGPATTSNGPDKWWSYDTERQAILAYVAANAAQVRGLLFWHGDTHLVGCTPGPANPYGGFSVYCAAPLLNIGGGLNQTTFTQRYNNGGSGECRQYGRIAVTDNGETITVNFQGWDAVAGVAQVQQTDVFGAPIAPPSRLARPRTTVPARRPRLAQQPVRPMVKLFHTAEAGAPGATVTVANSGGSPDGSAQFDNVPIGPTNSLVYDNTRSAHGTQSLMVATGATTGTALAEWNGKIGTQPQVWWRVYCWIPGPLPVAPAWRPFAARAAAGHAGSLLFNGSAMQLSASPAFNTVAVFTTPPPVGQWFRVEGFVIGDPVAGVISGSLYRAMDSTVPDETRTVTAQNTTGLLINAFFGQNNSSASSGPFWLDDIGVSTIGPLGPSFTPLPPPYAVPRRLVSLPPRRTRRDYAPAAAAGPVATPGGRGRPRSRSAVAVRRPGRAVVVPSLPLAVLLANNAEGSPGQGVTVTAGNSGGASGAPWDAVVIGALATMTYDGARVAHGGWAYLMTTGSPAANSIVEWTTSLTGAAFAAQVWFRIYVFLPAYSATQLRVVGARSGVTTRGNVATDSSGHVALLNAAGGGVKFSTSVVPLNRWFRLEGFILGDPVAGQIECRMFTSDPDGAVPDEVVTSAANINTGGVINRLEFGNPSSAVSFTMSVDDVAASTTGYIGPVARTRVLPSLLRAPLRWARRFARVMRPAPVPVAPDLSGELGTGRAGHVRGPDGTLGGTSAGGSPGGQTPGGDTRGRP